MKGILTLAGLLVAGVLLIIGIISALAQNGPPGQRPSLLEVTFINQGWGNVNVEWHLPTGWGTSPGVIWFGNGQSSVTSKITLTNDGPVTIRVLTPYVTGENNKDFTFDMTRCHSYLLFRDPKVIAPGIDPNQQCEIDVIFRPTAPGTRYGKLSVPVTSVGNVPPTPQTVPPLAILRVSM